MKNILLYVLLAIIALSFINNMFVNKEGFMSDSDIYKYYEQNKDTIETSYENFLVDINKFNSVTDILLKHNPTDNTTTIDDEVIE